MISLQTLTKVATGLGVAIVATGYGLRYKLQCELRETDFYKDAMQYLHNHSKALELLGTPITEQGVDIGDKEAMGSLKNITWLQIPVRGTKTSGSLRVEALMKLVSETEVKTDIYKVELMVNELPGTVYVIKDDSKSVEDVS